MTTRGRTQTSLMAMLLAGTLSLMVMGVATPARAQRERTSRATFSYTCCRTPLAASVYHPGQTIEVRWIPVSNAPSEEPVVTVTLGASISGPYSSVASLKSSFARPTPVLGTTNSSALLLRHSNLTTSSLVSRILIPPGAGPGYYELTDTLTSGSTSSRGGVIIRIAK